MHVHVYEIIISRMYSTLYICVCVSHMTLKQTRNSLFYMTVCFCSELCDYRDSSTELLELQHFAQPRLEVTKNGFIYE